VRPELEVDGQASSEDSPPDRLDAWAIRAQRASLILAAFSLILVSWVTWGAVVALPITGAIAVPGLVLSVVAVIAALALPARQLDRLGHALLVLALIVVAGWAITALFSQPGYGTDEGAFEQYAANLLLHGHDPYLANLSPALTQFRVPPQFATYLLGGGTAHNLDYPALPVLVAALFVEITGGVQSVPIADLVALAVTCVVAYVVIPRPFKTLSIVVAFGLPMMFNLAVAGLNETFMSLSLVVVAWRWTDTGSTGALLRRDIIRAICLGLAVSTSPLAWLVAPFVLVGLLRMRQNDFGRRRGLVLVSRYCAWAAGTFVVLNLPFIVAGASAWWSDVLAPIKQQAIPSGQGLIDGPLFFHIGGGSLAAFSFATALAYLALLGLFAARFDRLGRTAFALPIFVLFFSTRALGGYFMMMVAVWAVSLLTTSASSFGHVPKLWCGRYRRLKLAAVFCPLLASTTFALATPPPLELTVLSVTTNGELQGVWEMQVSVTNTSGERQSPLFAVNYTGYTTSFYHRLIGPASLAPGQGALYTLVAPNIGSMPGLSTPFVVMATTASPGTVSVSDQYVPQPISTELEPEAVNPILAPGTSTTFEVQLRSQFGGPVDQAGVRIALGQIIYGQEALIDAQASINGEPEGKTPVIESTNSDGLAIFRVADDQPQPEPIYLQAWIVGRYPYGYSNIVTVLWRYSGG
jgi:uncharacterized membrane protein